MRCDPPRSIVAVLVALVAAGSFAPASSAAPAATVTDAVRPATAIGTLAAANPAMLNLDDLRTRIDETSAALRVASSEFQQLDRDVQRTSSITDELRVETAEVADVTLRNAIDGYRHSEVPQGLLSAEDLNASMRATALGSAAVSSDTESFDAYRTLRKDLEISEEELVFREALAAEAEAEMERLEEQLNVELVRFGELEERRIQVDAAGVAVQADNRAQARGRKQGFYLDTCPVNGTHEFIDSWGFARPGGRRHQGVDMLARPGVELVAPVSGRVEHFSNSVGGRSYRIFGDDGNYFYGTHLSAFGKQGQLNAGEVIGYVGDDGNARGIPHLHFEIHPGGRGNPINPYIDVAAVCDGDG